MRVEKLEFKIDRKIPIEVGEFSRGLQALGLEYQRFLRSQHPTVTDANTELFVEKIVEGSIIIELIGAALPLLEGAKTVYEVVDFVDYLGDKFRALMAPGGRLESANKSELARLTDMATMVATDPNGNAHIIAVEHEETSLNKTTKTCFVISGQEASNVVKNAESQLLELQEDDQNRHIGVLMTLYQTNKATPEAEKTSGEKGVIEAVTPKPLPLIYASGLAGQRIKAAWGEERHNPYELGFVVDVDVQTVRGKPKAYRIMNVQEVIELDEEA